MQTETCDEPTLTRETLPSLNRKARREMGKRKPLAHCIHLSGQPALNRESVKRYMAVKLDAVRNPKPILQQKTVARFSGDFAASVILLIGILCPAVLTLTSLSPVGPAWRTASLLSFLTLGIMVGYWIAIQDKVVTEWHQPMRRILADWQIATMEERDDGGGLTIWPPVAEAAIPAEVQTQAETLHSRLPGVELLVHYLYEDPFLEAVYKHPTTGEVESYFVAAWDEKGLIA